MRSMWQLVLLAAVLTPSALHGQQIRARVIDESQRSALTAAQVLVTDSAGTTHASAVTDANGFFTIDRLAVGGYTLVVQRAGYSTVNQPLVVRGTAPITLPAIMMQLEAVVLDPVRAEAEREDPSLPREEAIRGEYVLAGSRLAELEKVNASPRAVYRELGVRVRETMGPGGATFCVGSNRGPNSMRGGGGAACEPVAVIVDGALVTNGTQILRNLKLGAWESVEYLNAVEAGQRFGLHASSSGGAIVLWSRGFGPHRNPARDGT